MPRSFNFGFSILEKSHEDVVVLQALGIIEESIMREWDSFDENMLCDLITKLSQVYETLVLSPSISIGMLKKCGDLLAKVIKREQKNLFNSFLSRIIESCARASIREYKGSFILLNSILDEFSDIKISIIHKSIKDALESRSNFEQLYLKQLFGIIVNKIKYIISDISSTEAINKYLDPLIDYLHILSTALETTMNWRFNLSASYLRIACFHDSPQTFEPPEDWTVLIREIDLTNIIFWLFYTYHDNPILSNSVQSIFILYSSLFVSQSNNLLKEYFLYSYNKCLSDILPIVTSSLTPQLVWTLCTSIQRFQSGCSRMRMPVYTMDALAVFISNNSLFRTIVDKIINLIDENNKSIFIDALIEFFTYIQNLRESVEHYGDARDPCILSLGHNLNLIGVYLIEQNLLPPIGTLILAPDKFGLYQPNKEQDIQNDRDWISESSYSFIERISDFFSNKFKLCVDELFDSNSVIYSMNQAFKDSNIFISSHTHNAHQLVLFFTHALIDHSSNCFMYFGIEQSLKTYTQQDTSSFLLNFFIWYNSKEYKQKPAFIQNISNCSSFVSFLILVLIYIQKIIEIIKNNTIPLKLSTTISSMLKYISYFDLLFEKVYIYNNCHSYQQNDPQSIIFIKDISEKNNLTTIILEVGYYIFLHSSQLIDLNMSATLLIVKVIKVAHKHSLFDSEWSYQMSITLLNNFMSLNNEAGHAFAQNLSYLITVSSFHSRIKDSYRRLMNEFLNRIDGKFESDLKAFPPYSYMCNGSKIEYVWVLNLSILQGILTKDALPKRTNVNLFYPTIINEFFSKFFKSFIPTLIRAIDNHILFSKFIRLFQFFISIFRHYSCDPNIILNYLEQFQTVSDTFFSAIKSKMLDHLSNSDLTELNQILKIYNRLCVFINVLIRVVQTLNSSSSYDPNSIEYERSFIFIKTLIVNVFLTAHPQFFIVPKFSLYIFKSLNEFVDQYSKRLLKGPSSDLLLICSFLSSGITSETNELKCCTYNSIYDVLKTIIDTNTIIEQSCLYPLIDSLFKIIINDPVNPDLIEYICRAFIYVYFIYKSKMQEMINQYLSSLDTPMSTIQNVSNIIESLITTSKISTTSSFEINDCTPIFIQLTSILKFSANK